MTRIIYRQSDETSSTVDVEDGMTLMEGAQLNGVPGIEAMCGGMCSCATCHVYLDSSWNDHVTPPAEAEQTMLENAVLRKDNSRLSCQITVEPGMDGLVVEIPSEQAQ